MKTLLLALIIVVAAHKTDAQSLDTRIASTRGTVGFDFDTRRNVCGNGVSINISDDTSAGWTTRSRRSGMHIGRGDGESTVVCEQGPAHVLLTRTGGAVTALSVAVGGRQLRADTEVGTVEAQEVARYLLAIAPRLTGRSADDAVMGAAIANGPSLWRRMLEIARAGDASESARKASLFWVSQEASSVATAGLSDVAMNDANGGAVQNDALFYLSQRHDGEGIPALIKVVRESKSVKLKKDAIFYLSQSHDPRALDLFESLLAGQ
jgi:hypothetical protein